MYDENIRTDSMCICWYAGYEFVQLINPLNKFEHRTAFEQYLKTIAIVVANEHWPFNATVQIGELTVKTFWTRSFQKQ